jgi:hypothetical protein
MVGLEKYYEIIAERPRKLNAAQVGYAATPDGSVMRCAACLHFYRRAIDGFGTCEIFRDEETDVVGILPNWRCSFWTVDGDVFPFQPEDEPEPPEGSEDIPF